MQLTRVTAIRHGETAWNAERRVQGHTDIGLSATGREQAARLAWALAGRERIDAIYSSDLARAFETARAIAAAANVAVRPETGLRERSFGRAEGLTFDDFSRRWPDEAERWRRRDPHWRSDGGESLLQFWERITGAVHRLGAQNLGKHVVLVTHGGVLDVLYRAATGLGLQDARTWQLGNCAINRLLWTPDSGLSLIGWADDGHLQQPAAADHFPDPSSDPDRSGALPVYHGAGGLAAGLTGLSSKAMLDAAEEERAGDDAGAYSASP
jgi:probable phosphoglycerate mutase